jgi:hypothetical protein
MHRGRYACSLHAYLPRSCVQSPGDSPRSVCSSGESPDDLQPGSRRSSTGAHSSPPDSPFAQPDVAERLRQQLQAQARDQQRAQQRSSTGRGSFAFSKPSVPSADAPGPMLTVQPQPALLHERSSSWTQLQLSMNQSDFRESDAGGSMQHTNGSSTVAATPTTATSSTASLQVTPSTASPAVCGNCRRCLQHSACMMLWGHPCCYSGSLT